MQNLPDTVKFPSGNPPARIPDVVEAHYPRPSSSSYASQPQSQPSQMPTPPTTPQKVTARTPKEIPPEPITPTSPHHSIGRETHETSTYHFNSPPSPGPCRSSVSPSTSPTPLIPPTANNRKEREARRLSTKDPLSDLQPLQRKILLKIMEATTADPETGMNLVDLVEEIKAEETFIDAMTIS